MNNITIHDEIRLSRLGLGNGTRWDIYIGAPETDAMRIIVKVAQKLQTEYTCIHFHIISGDAVDIQGGIEKGLLDFGILMGPIDKSRYEFLEFPIRDIMGVLMRKDSKLALQETINPKDLWKKSLIVPRQLALSYDLAHWLSTEPSKLKITGTYTLLYNASLMVEEGMGYALGLDKIINTTGNSSLCFRPLSPAITVGINILWKRDHKFTKEAEVFINSLSQHISTGV